MEVVKTYTQTLPQVKFIGKKYGDEDRVNGSYAFAWEQFLEKGLFDTIIAAGGGIEQFKTIYEDGDASLGFMRYKEGEPFQYWIGMFAPVSTAVPEGFEAIDIKQSNLGICWYLGQEPGIYAKEEVAMNKLTELGHKILPDEEGAIRFFERYSPTRFNKDENGNVTLDIGFFIE